MRDTHFSKKGSSRFKDVGEKWYRLKSNGHGPVKLPSSMIVRISGGPGWQPKPCRDTSARRWSPRPRPFL